MTKTFVHPGAPPVGQRSWSTWSGRIWR